MKKLTKVLASIALAALVVWSIPAAAGIIVTVGKLPTFSDGDGTKTGDAARRPTAGDPTSTAMPGVENTTMNKQTAKTSTSDCGTTCAPTSEPTDGAEPYDSTRCVPLGGGLLYCDDPGMGAGVGAGEGGSFDEDELAVTPDGTEEVAALGCSGGGEAAPLGLALLLLGGFAVVRRRRDVIG
ncbi:MAG: hypothetical protein EP329_17265 [Deltaproteobacteria bacterium]|nr:MAG: hypothetical protein EP329_17265 [Deltaproteobacteria bacterium]